MSPLAPQSKLLAALRLAETRSLLLELGFDGARSNARSAWTLLALLRLRPEDPWTSATDPLVKTRDIMDWIRDHYGMEYEPNTRETIRRQTLHQFLDAALVELNPDDPSRPTNSPKSVYRMAPSALDAIRTYGSHTWPDALATYLAMQPTLIQTYAAAREQNLLPVTLPDGSPVTLSAGGQNVLLKAMVEDFCARFTPGGKVVYIGDAGNKWVHFDDALLAHLGVTVNSHGAMPDLIVYMEDRNWLVLMEAASTHGPVDARRYGVLSRLFAGCSAGLVYVSCFPSRAEMRRFLDEIAWETEVWCADAPSHMVHFNGSRFLGPYE
jgi:hypothetical protein